MSIEEAVARFFSTGSGYDHTQAKRMIQWLDKCGYSIVPKKAKHVRDTKAPTRKAA